MLLNFLKKYISYLEKFPNKIKLTFAFKRKSINKERKSMLFSETKIAFSQEKCLFYYLKIVLCV